MHSMYIYIYKFDNNISVRWSQEFASHFMLISKHSDTLHVALSLGRNGYEGGKVVITRVHVSFTLSLTHSRSLFLSLPFLSHIHTREHACMHTHTRAHVINKYYYLYQCLKRLGCLKQCLRHR